MPNEITRTPLLGGNWPANDTTEASPTAGELRESVAETARGASAKVQAAVDGVAGAASSVRQKAGEYLEASAPRVKEFAGAAADRITATADYVRHTDADRMRADVEAVVKNHPGAAMIAAAAVGFLLGRALTRD